VSLHSTTMENAGKLAIVCALSAAAAFGETQQKFEVASIKPGAPGMMHSVQIQITGGRFTASGVSVKLLIQQAYGVRNFQIAGGPGWIGSDTFDINAKSESGAKMDQEGVKQMLQSLLADRFQLKFSRDTKEMPIYTLVVGKGGSKLKESEAGSPQGQMMMRTGMIEVKGGAMPGFAGMLGNQIGRKVEDKTGLTANYDFKLEFTPEQGHQMGPQNVGGPEPAAQVDAPGPTIFTALQEQLGLKLESARGPVEMLTIERVEKPTEN
jgi:bla regulator protein blaR1